MLARLFVLLALVVSCSSCQTEVPSSKPEPLTSATISPGQTRASAVPSAAPLADSGSSTMPSAAPSASATVGDDGSSKDEGHCVSAKESQEIAKPHQNAAPPYSACAEGIFAHCGGGNGERGHLCSRPLDPKLTALTRKTKPNSCCYRFQ